MKRLVKITEGPVLEEDNEIDAYLAQLRETPKRDVEALLQSLTTPVDNLEPYELKLLGVLEIPEVTSGGESFTNPLYEDVDIEIDIDGGSKREMRFPWKNYYFLLQIPEEQPLIIEAQMTITRDGNWINEFHEWLPLIEILIESDRHTDKKEQLIQQRAVLYHNLKLEIIKRLEEIRNN